MGGRWRFGMAVVMFLAQALATGAARGEVAEIRIAQPGGMTHLPLRVLAADRLIEPAAKAQDIPAPQIAWVPLDGPEAMQAALEADRIDVAAGDTVELIRRWSDSGGAIVGLAAVSALPWVLATNRPDRRTLDDLTDRDRIAVAAPGRSLDSALLEIAQERRDGAAARGRLARLQVAMTPAAAMAALLAGRPDPRRPDAPPPDGADPAVTAAFLPPPFLYQALSEPRIHRLFGSVEVLPVRSTTGVLWGKAAFFAANPRTTAALLAALDAADQAIHDAPRRAAALYVEAEQPQWSLMAAEITLRNPSHLFTTTPSGTLRLAEQLGRAGLKPVPKTWSALFVPALADRPGS